MLNIIIIGGDKRQKIMGDILKEKGFNIIYYDPSIKISNKEDIVILPTPVTKDGIHITGTETDSPLTVKKISEIFPLAKLIIGGAFKNKYIYDLTLRDDFAFYNAVPTAEGAIALAVDNTDFTLWNSKILVCGFGRVGKMLVSRLLSFNSDLYVSARNNTDFSLLDANGIKRIETKSVKDYIKNFDIVFNTVNAEIFNDDVLQNARKDTLFIELATANAGFNNEALLKYGIRFLKAPALPGRTAYITAGQIMAHTVLNILKEKHLY